MNDDATVDAPIGAGRYPPGYEIRSTLGSGAFGTVYEARDVELDRVVALKVLTSADNSVVRERFVREMRTLAALSGHPHVAALHTTGQSPDGTPWFTMDLYRAGSARDLIDRDGPLAWPDAVVLGSKIASALEAAHERGIIHRDVKPSNILIDDYGEPRLADFGVARVIEHGDLTTTGGVTGTLAHLAPELLTGAAATPASDTYALASTLHQLLTGSAPYAGRADESVAAVLSRISTAPPPDLRAAGVPDVVAATIGGALAKDPSARPASAAAFGAALDAAREAALGGAAAGTMSPTRIPLTEGPTADLGEEIPSPKHLRSRRIALAFAAVVACALLFGTIWLRSRSTSTVATPPATAPTLIEPVAAAASRDGSVYVADRATHRVVRVAADGTTTTIAGRGDDVDDGDGGPATRAGLSSPGPVAIDQAGRPVLTSGGRLRRVLDDGTIVGVDIAVPNGVYLSDGRLGFAPNGDVCTAVDRRLLCGPEGGSMVPVDLAGLPPNFSVDGFAFDGDQVVLASAETATVVRGPRGGPYTTIAGGGTLGDGAPATSAALVGPGGVTVEPDGDIVIAELGANRIRRVRAADGRIETAAGKPNDFSEGYVDSPDPHAARFNRTTDVVAGPDGQLIVVDQLNRHIRRIAADGSVTTVI